MTPLMILIMLTIAGYGIAGSLLCGYYFFALKEKARIAGLALLGFSFFLLVAAFIGTITNPTEVPFLLLFAIILNGLFISLMRKWKIHGIAPLLSMFTMVILGAHVVHIRAALPSALALSSSPWFGLHILAFLFSYSCFSLAAFCSILYLYQARLLKKKSLRGAFLLLPPLKDLDEASYRFMGIGFPLLALGFFFGSLWSHMHLGIYWSFRPGGITAVIITLIYLACIHTRMISRWQGVRFNIMLVISFFLMLLVLMAAGHLPL
jgi:ABC-type transport system involved in cytochrome c biogenesis permease subunit